MNFDKLFRNVFITEADDQGNIAPEGDLNSSIATAAAKSAVSGESSEEVPTDAEGSEDTTDAIPDNYDVEGAPVVSPAGDAGTLKTYLTKLNECADSLNGIESDSLQKLVNDLDRPGSLFQGISREISADIIKLAEQTASLAQILQGFIINSSKRARDLSNTQQQG